MTLHFMLVLIFSDPQPEEETFIFVDLDLHHITAYNCYAFFFLNSLRNWFRFFLFSCLSESSFSLLSTLTEVTISFMLSSDCDFGISEGLELWDISRELEGRLLFPVLSRSLSCVADRGRFTTPPFVTRGKLCLVPLESESESSVRVLSVGFSISEDDGESDELQQKWTGSSNQTSQSNLWNLSN